MLDHRLGLLLVVPHVVVSLALELLPDFVVVLVVRFLAVDASFRNSLPLFVQLPDLVGHRVLFEKVAGHDALDSGPPLRNLIVELLELRGELGLLVVPESGVGDSLVHLPFDDGFDAVRLEGVVHPRRGNCLVVSLVVAASRMPGGRAPG